MTDDISRSLNKCDEDVERATTDFNRLTILLQQSFGRTEAERTKRNNATGSCIFPIIHRSTCPMLIKLRGILAVPECM